MPNGRLTKKEINRFNKVDLLKICIDNGVECNKKMSKRDLVALAFKNKTIRGMEAKPKRKMSEKQMANLNKFRLGGKNQKDFKNEQLIKPKSTYLAELSKLEDKEVTAPKSENQGSKIKVDNKVDSKLENVREREHFDSTNKVSDEVKQELRGKREKKTNERLELAESSARHNRDVRFGQGFANPEFIVADLLDDFGKLNLNKIKRLKLKLEKSDPKNPSLQVIRMLFRIASNEKQNKQLDKQKNKRPTEAQVLSIVNNQAMVLALDDPDGILSREEMGEINRMINSGDLDDVNANDLAELERFIGDFFF